MTLLPILLRLATAITLLTVPLPAFATGLDIQNMLLGVIRAFYPIVIPITVLVVVIAGFILMTSQDEGRLQKAKATLIAVAIGAIILGIFTAFTDTGFIALLYNGTPSGLITGTSLTLSFEAAGVSDWLTGMAAMLGILIIIVSVLRAVLSFGADEAAYSKVRYAVLHAIAGMTIIALAYVFKTVLFQTFEPSAILVEISAWVFLLIAVISTIAVCVLVYAGLRMVISYGREEEFTAAKNLALRVVVGLLILALSFVLVWIVQQIFT